MCGIAGMVTSGEAPGDAAALDRMAARLVHRGPDQAGTWTGPGAGLAVRRLAVIDPAGSRQPLAGPGGTRLAFNGEVYNYRDLRRELAEGGAALATEGDGEPILHLYAAEGEAALARLDGMFALALWDGERRLLLLARDRLGQKPLYWHHAPGRLVFASEPAALLAAPGVPRDVDPVAVADALRFGYVPAPATGLRGVHKLPPGHLLVYDAAADRLDGPRRWWDIPRRPPTGGFTAEAWAERIRTELAASVRARLVADVPLGVLLSGGLDSSVITALAAEGGGTVRTFTARFPEAAWDESAYAREVAHRFGTEHVEIEVRPDVVADLPAIVRHHGEPFADSSSLATWALCREVRRHVTVALGGDGGDELFGGYPRHAALLMTEGWPAALRHVLAALAPLVPRGFGRKSFLVRARRLMGPLAAPAMRRSLAWRSVFGDEALADLLTPEAAAHLAEVAAPLDRWAALAGGLDPDDAVDCAMAIDLQDYLPDDCLAKVDRASMAHGLEVRSPMLAARVVEVARRMPVDLRWSRRRGRVPRGKRVLREAFARDLPPAVLGRGKMGFGVPVGEWLAGPRAEWLREVLLDPRTLGRGWWRRAAVERLLRDHTRRRADHTDHLWTLLCLELWHREVVEAG